jgi:hypothetical protein
MSREIPQYGTVHPHTIVSNTRFTLVLLLLCSALEDTQYHLLLLVLDVVDICPVGLYIIGRVLSILSRPVRNYARGRRELSSDIDCRRS